jgi:alpha-L-fucosidase
MLTIDDLLYQLASTVACGGNMLLNVGPTSEGVIIPVFAERLLQIGAWLKVNGDSIYGKNSFFVFFWIRRKILTLFCLSYYSLEISERYGC